MHRPFRFHPGPLTILVAIVLCLVASLAFGQARRLSPGAPRAAPATTGVLPGGLPAPSGLTSGGAPALPAGSPAASGLTSGTTGGSAAAAASTGPGGITGADTTATTVGGSTRGVVVLPAETGMAPGTVVPATPTTSPAEAGATAGAVVVQPGAAGATAGWPSAAPTRQQFSGPVSALQVAQLFAQADADGDGLLTRAEALRLPVVTMSFDDMDTNRDGVVSRSEYEASLR